MEENPTTRTVAVALDFARAHRIDLIVAVGGGSSMDCAKGVNFLLTNGGQMSDYKGFGKATKPMLPSIGVPTTAGTGSEGQSFALIADEKTHLKMACGDRKAAFRVGVLDPEVTVSQPRQGHGRHRHRRRVARPGVLRHHAPQSAVADVRAGGVAAAGRQLRDRCCAGPATSTPAAPCRLGAYFAGVAIENSMLGVCHALANPLTAHYGLTHGIAIGVLLPHVVRFNAAEVGGLYGDLAHEVGLLNGDGAAAGEVLALRVLDLLRAAELPTRLSECGVSPGIFPVLAEEASQQWTGRFNPRPVTEADLRQLYEAALDSGQPADAPFAPRKSPLMSRRITSGLSPLPSSGAALAACLAVAADPAAEAAKDAWPVFRGNALETGAVPADALPDKLVELWKFSAKDAIDGAPAVADGVVYVGSEDEHLYAVDLATGAKKWEYKAGPIKASPAYRDGAVYVGDSNGMFHCVDAKTGQKRWTFTTGAEITSGANFAGDNILFGSYDETLYCLDKDGNKVWQFKTAGPVNGSPAVAGDRTFVAGCDSSLHVIDLTRRARSWRPWTSAARRPRPPP